jgi:hypothetical protein
MRWAENVARTFEIRNGYKISVRKCERKRLSYRPRHIWEDNIKMDIVDIGCEGVDWIQLASD